MGRPERATYPLHGQARSRVHAGSGAPQKLQYGAGGGLAPMSGMDTADSASVLASAVIALSDTLAQHASALYP